MARATEGPLQGALTSGVHLHSPVFMGVICEFCPEGEGVGGLVLVQDAQVLRLWLAVADCDCLSVEFRSMVIHIQQSQQEGARPSHGGVA